MSTYVYKVKLEKLRERQNHLNKELNDLKSKQYELKTDENAIVIELAELKETLEGFDSIQDKRQLSIDALYSEINRIYSFPLEYMQLEFDTDYGYGINGIFLREGDVILVKRENDIKEYTIKKKWKYNENFGWWSTAIDNFIYTGNELALFYDSAHKDLRDLGNIFKKFGGQLKEN